MPTGYSRWARHMENVPVYHTYNTHPHCFTSSTAPWNRNPQFEWELGVSNIIIYLPAASQIKPWVINHGNCICFSLKQEIPLLKWWLEQNLPLKMKVPCLTAPQHHSWDCIHHKKSSHMLIRGKGIWIYRFGGPLIRGYWFSGASMQAMIGDFPLSPSAPHAVLKGQAGEEEIPVIPVLLKSFTGSKSLSAEYCIHLLKILVWYSR